MPEKSLSYHHGDLKTQLIEQATVLVEEQGIDALSVRKLADIIGVSRTALYHHFKNKNDLLAAIAEAGFNEWRQISTSILADNSDELVKLKAYIKQYISFATSRTATYDLMFGKAIWQNELNTSALNETAYACFEEHVQLVKHWQSIGLVLETENSLRLAQVTWSTLHGMSKLFNDGVYVDLKHLDQLCDTMVSLFNHRK